MILLALNAIFLLCFEVLLVRQLRRLPVGPDHPTCGKCSYNVTGLPSDTCPECGSNLREVGIVQPKVWQPWSGSKKLFGWTVLLLPWLVILHGLLLPIWPTYYSVSRSRFIDCRDPEFSTRGFVFQVGQGTRWGGSQLPQSIPFTSMSIQFSGKQSTPLIFVFGLRTKHYYFGGVRHDDKPLDAATLADCFRAVRADLSSERAMKDVSDIMAYIDTMSAPINSFVPTGTDAQHPGVSATLGPVGFFSEPAPWGIWVYAGSCVAIWCAGAVIIWRRSRRHATGGTHPMSATEKV